MEARTESASVFANPDSTFTLEQSAAPIRRQRDGQWHDLDPTLSRSAEGRVEPALAAMDMDFSGGGDRQLARITREGHELTLTWPRPLPEPVIDGDSAVYRDVHPDVDLQINVTKESFSHVLIVHTPAAAQLPELRTVELGMEAPGLTVSEAKGGGLEARDPSGIVVFSAPAPQMWDSSGSRAAEPSTADRREAPLEGDSIAAMPVEVSTDSVVVTPDRTLVEAPATVYPLHIDPVFSGVRIARAMINEHYPTTPTWGWSGDEGIGYQAFEPWSRKRLFFGFDISKVAGAQIISSTFTAFETWAASCTPKVVEVWKTAKATPNTNWASGSGSSVWQQKVAIATVAHGREGCDPGGYRVPFNVRSAVAQQAAANAATLNLGMRAADEDDQYAWKRFRYDVTLSVTYNYPPSVVRPRTEAPVTGCATSSTNRPAIGDSSPRLVVGVTDPDSVSGDKAMAEFQVRRAVDVAPLWTGKTGGYVEPGADVRFMPSAEVEPLSTNTTYAWRARAWDGDAHSAWSQECFFYVDLAKPPSPRIVVTTPGPYQVGKPVSFKITGDHPDIKSFRYAFDTVSPGSTVIPKSSGVLTATPRHVGPWYARAWSVDAAGNPSDLYGEVSVRVDGPDDLGVWAFDENSGDSTADGSGHGRTMYFGTGAAWDQGDRHTVESPDHSVYLPGLQTSGATTATSATDLIDTSQNFSAFARVQLGIKSNRQVILSEDRPGLSSFALGVSEMRWTGKDTADPNDDDPSEREVKFTFTIATAGPDGPARLETVWLPYQEGNWVSLAVTYTAGIRKLELFVNGVSRSNGIFSKESSVTDGSGPFRTGLAIDGGSTHFFRGKVDDIRLYETVADAGTIRAHAFGDN